AGRLPVPPSARSARLAETMRARDAAQQAALRTVAQRLGGTRYCVYKTVRPFPYVSHDVDVLVDDVAASGARFGLEDGERAHPGLPFFDLLTAGGIEIELYDRIVPGLIDVVDNTSVWPRTCSIEVAGGSVVVPAPEVEVLALLAEAAVRLFE